MSLLRDAPRCKPEPYRRGYMFFTFVRPTLWAMEAQRLARISLLIDALYCAVVGGTLVVLRERLARVLRLPAVVVAAAGLTTVGWAVLVLTQAGKRDWRVAAKRMAAANAAGAGALALGAAVHPRPGARAILAFTAIEVFAFVVPPMVALLRRERPSESE